ncbi:MAG: SMI1/KNR4 family protein [Anaerolineales bacterium]
MHPWHALLDKLNQATLASENIESRAVPDSKLASGWLGYDGAEEAALSALEARLGCTLPPSYREFLKASDGFLLPGPGVQRLYGTLDVRWFRDENQFQIDIWRESVGPDDPPLEDDLGDLLEIAGPEPGESARLLLNPNVMGRDGEWEAWFFEDWMPGADKYPSFYALMEARLAAQYATNALQREQHTSGAGAPGAALDLLQQLKAFKAQYAVMFPWSVIDIDTQIARVRAIPTDDPAHWIAELSVIESELAEFARQHQVSFRDWTAILGDAQRVREGARQAIQAQTRGVMAAMMRKTIKDLR